MANPLATLTVNAAFIREELTEGAAGSDLAADELAALEALPDNPIEDALVEAFESEAFQCELTRLVEDVLETIRPQLSNKI